MCASHLTSKSNPARRELYRIFFYDCPPVTKKAHWPITRRAIDFSKTPTALFRTRLHDEIRRLRKTALRLGHLSEDAGWALRPERLKALLKGDIAVANLADDDFFYDVKQKGVDMRVGVDIASLAFKHQVDQIVLIAGDADFVPAAKLARREGIDFVLDPMWHPIHPSLNEHIDGLRSTCPNPARPRGEPTLADDIDPDLP
ncbi:MAG TPA: NYN domain-containing protein [Acetobacteraceae bacterium]|nr:NYN domain-containing protein [Acetobacteraceae bacterium]